MVDKTQNEQSFPPLAEVLVGDYYIGAKILLPRGDQMTRGYVVAQSLDAHGNALGRAHANPILDTRTYQVDFVGGKVTELTTNFIAKLMYSSPSQCMPSL